MKKLITILLRKREDINLILWVLVFWLLIIFLMMQGIAEARTDVLIFSPGQEPQIFKTPQFADLGTQPLCKDDKIVDAVRYTAKGKNIYSKIIKYHEKTYLDKKWNPKNIRMLVVVKNENKAFSLSGNVAANFQEYIYNNTTGVSPGGSLNKSTSNSLGSSGSIFPSFTKSWIDQKFEIWFFLVEGTPPAQPTGFKIIKQ